MVLGFSGLVSAQQVLFEDFKGLMTSVEQFWTAAYKSVPGNADIPLYRNIEGEYEIVNGKLKMTGARFTIGTDRTTETTKDDTEAGGYLDLTKPYRITIKFLEIGGDTNKKLSVMIDNNTETGAASMHGNPGCRPYNVRLSELPEEKIILIDVNPAVGTKNSFLQIRIEDGTGWIILDSIAIEYI
ncbi:MAG TPA: hypothetical protein GX699_08460 [Firmicutes bacterium]|nr:hypothetical protein [Bacillota bacterium]